MAINKTNVGQQSTTSMEVNQNPGELAKTSTLAISNEGSNHLDFLKSQQEAYVKDKERHAEFNTAALCLEMVLNKEKIHLYNRSRLAELAKAKQTVETAANYNLQVGVAFRVVINGFIERSTQIKQFYLTADKFEAGLGNNKTSKFKDYYRKGSFVLHTSNDLIALLPALNGLDAFIKLQKQKRFKNEKDAEAFVSFEKYVQTFKQEYLKEIKQRLTDSKDGSSLHPFIRFVETAIGSGNLPQGRYYPDFIAQEERSPGVKAELLQVFFALTQGEDAIDAKLLESLLDITKIISDAKIDNQQLIQPSKNEEHYSYKYQRYQLQCEIAPRLTKCQDILAQLTVLNNELNDINSATRLDKTHDKPARKAYLQAKQQALYQEAAMILSDVHRLAEKTRKSSILGSLYLGKQTTKFLADIEQTCLNMDKKLREQLPQGSIANSNDYLQGQIVDTVVINIKDQAIVVHKEIKHFAGSLSSKVNQYLIESSKRANWQRYNDSFLAIVKELKFPKVEPISDIDSISGETVLKADTINFNPFCPLNITHEITDNDQHYLGNFSTLSNEQINILLQNTKQMRDALISQKQILRENFDQFSPLQKLLYRSLYVREKKALDTQLSLVVKPLENRLNGEIFRRLTLNLRYGHLDRATQAAWEHTLKDSRGFFSYKLNEEQTDSILKELSKEEAKLKKSIRGWFTSSKKSQDAKRKMAQLKDMQRSLNYQLKMKHEKKMESIELTIDNEFARSFIAKINKHFIAESNKQKELKPLNTTCLENLVQRKEVQMYEIQRNELQAIMSKLIELHGSTKESGVFGEFYTSFSSLVSEKGYFEFQLPEMKHVGAEALINDLFSEKYNAETRLAFATWLARHRTSLVDFNQQNSVSESVKALVNELLKLIPKKSVSYSTAVKDLVKNYNTKQQFRHKLSDVKNIEEWMQKVKTEPGHKEKTEAFLEELKRQLGRNPNDDTLLFKISYLSQMLGQVASDDDLLSKEFEEKTNPLKARYQAEIDNNFNTILEIICTKAHNDFYFHWLQSAIRSELTRVKSLGEQSAFFMPEKLSGKEIDLASYRDALAIILAMLEGKKSSLTKAEIKKINSLEVDNSRSARTTDVTNIYSNLCQRCAARIKSMIITPRYTADFRTKLANYANLVASYKKDNESRQDYGQTDEDVKKAKTALQKLINQPRDIEVRNPTSDGKPATRRSPNTIYSFDDLWQAILLVQLDKAQWTEAQKALQDYVQNYTGNDLKLCALVVSFCGKGRSKWQRGNEEIVAAYADKYFSSLLTPTRELILTESFDEAKLAYLLKQVPQTHTGFNSKLADWIKVEGRKWSKQDQNLFNRLPVTLANRTAYANLGLRELLAEIPAKNADSETINRYKRKFKDFVNILVDENQRQLYLSYSGLGDESKAQLDSIMAEYLQGKFTTAGMPIGNGYDDKLVATICGHNAPHLRDLRLYALGRLLKAAVDRKPNDMSFIASEDEIIESYKAIIEIFSQNEPNTLLPEPASEEDYLKLDQMLNDTLGKGPWRKVVDKLLQYGDTSNELIISKFIKLEYLSRYRLQHLQHLLGLPELTTADLREFCEFIKDRSCFTNEDFATLQDMLVRDLSSKGWTECLAKLVSQYGDERTKEICLAKLFAKALADKDTQIIEAYAQNNGLDLFRTPEGQMAIIEVLEEYRRTCISQAKLAERQTAYSQVTQQILQIIDVNYEAYRGNEGKSFASKPGQLSLEHAIAGLVQLAYKDFDNCQTASEALKSYLTTLPAAIKHELKATAKSWFDGKSLNVVLQSLHSQLVKGPKHWNAGLFAVVEKFATPDVYDDFIISHGQLLLTTAPELREAGRFLPNINDIDENSEDRADKGFLQFRTKDGVAKFAAMLDEQLAEWYGATSINGFAAYQRLSNLLKLHITEDYILNLDLINQVLVELLTIMRDSRPQSELKFLKALNDDYAQWLKQGSTAVDYQQHREFLAQTFENSFRKVNGEVATDLVLRVFKQYRLLTLLQNGGAKLVTDEMLNLVDIEQETAKNISPDSFVNWYVPASETEKNEFGKLLAEKAKEINSVMRNLLNKWTENLCDESDVCFHMVKSILTDKYLQLLGEQDEPLAKELGTRFKQVTQDIERVKQDRIRRKELLAKLDHIDEFDSWSKSHYLNPLAGNMGFEAYNRLLDELVGAVRVSVPNQDLNSDPLYQGLQGAPVRDDLLRTQEKTELLVEISRDSNNKIQIGKGGLLCQIRGKLRQKDIDISAEKANLQGDAKLLEELIQKKAEIDKLEDTLQKAMVGADGEFYQELNQDTKRYEEAKIQIAKGEFNAVLSAFNKRTKSRYQLTPAISSVALSELLQQMKRELQEKQSAIESNKQLLIKVGYMVQAFVKPEAALKAFEDWKHEVLLLDKDELISLAVILDEKRFNQLKHRLTTLSQDETNVSASVRNLYDRMLKLLEIARASKEEISKNVTDAYSKQIEDVQTAAAFYKKLLANIASYSDTVAATINQVVDSISLALSRGSMQTIEADFKKLQDMKYLTKDEEASIRDKLSNFKVNLATKQSEFDQRAEKAEEPSLPSSPSPLKRAGSIFSLFGRSPSKQSVKSTGTPMRTPTGSPPETPPLSKTGSFQIKNDHEDRIIEYRGRILISDYITDDESQEKPNSSGLKPGGV